MTPTDRHGKPLDLHAILAAHSYDHPADLAGANLDWASLRGASLRWASLDGASLDGARSILTVGPCDGWIMHAVQHNEGPRIHAGCHWFRVHEARAHWDGSQRPEHDAKMIAGVDALLLLARANGWPT